MKKQLQTPHDLLWAVTQKRGDLVGTEKTMPVNKPDDVVVASRQLDGRDRENAFKAGKAFVIHSATLMEIGKMRETLELAGGAKNQLPNLFFKRAFVAIQDSGQIALCRTWKHLIL
jgi:hypothetical protein